MADTGNTERIIELSGAQNRALVLMGKSDDDIANIIRSTIAARIRGAFNKYREAEEKVNASMYDRASISGAKWPMSKDEFLKAKSADSAAISGKL